MTYHQHRPQAPRDPTWLSHQNNWNRSSRRSGAPPRGPQGQNRRCQGQRGRGAVNGRRPPQPRGNQRRTGPQPLKPQHQRNRQAHTVREPCSNAIVQGWKVNSNPYQVDVILLEHEMERCPEGINLKLPGIELKLKIQKTPYQP